ncbi:MAG: NADH-quinone oxidoreductase subunit A, partial [Cytophagaceae bacterium]
FMYPWAVNFRQLGTAGFVEMIIFMTLLMAGFGYVIKKGILRWNEAPAGQTYTAKPVLENRPAEIGQAA